MTKPRVPARVRRGAAILPSLFTIGNLFLGFWSLIKAYQGRFEEASLFIGVAMVLDMLDGRIARLTGTASAFGAELDSLADVISFGVSPAFLAYCWAFNATLPRAGWLGSFLFVTCVALRLARFNVQRTVVDGRYFVGLPSPAGAWPVAALVHSFPDPIGDRVTAFLVLAGVLSLAFLMVSKLRYWSFKNVDLGRRRSYIDLLWVALALAVIVNYREYVPLGLGVAYTLSGPIAHAAGTFRRRGGAPPEPVAPETEAAH